MWANLQELSTLGKGLRGSLEYEWRGKVCGERRNGLSHQNSAVAAPASQALGAALGGAWAGGTSSQARPSLQHALETSQTENCKHRATPKIIKTK